MAGGRGAKRAIVRWAGRTAPRVAPLRVRKAAAKAVNRLPGRQKEALILALLSDWAERDPAEYHRFIWSNHLSYARYYDFRELAQSRGAYFSRLHPLRMELFDMIAAYLRPRGVDPAADVRSFLDVGCSLGYLPRFAETTAFPAASRILGLDIDAHAIAAGRAYLGSAGSAARLEVADVGALDTLLRDERFDVVTCTGVLQYLDEEAAAHAVAAMLRHTSMVLALSGPACGEMDNGTLQGSRVRGYDHSLVHNFDRMVGAAGGRVVARRWDGSERVDGKLGAYLVVAVPETTDPAEPPARARVGELVDSP